MRVEILRINGDIYINGQKSVFAVDFNNPPTSDAEYHKVGWLLGWAKIGLMSLGHEVPHFESKTIQEFEANLHPMLNEKG